MNNRLHIRNAERYKQGENICVACMGPPENSDEHPLFDAVICTECKCLAAREHFLIDFIFASTIGAVDIVSCCSGVSRGHCRQHSLSQPGLYQSPNDSFYCQLVPLPVILQTSKAAQWKGPRNICSLQRRINWLHVPSVSGRVMLTVQVIPVSGPFVQRAVPHSL
ncbi:uncharacterized protein LOC124596079 [Schistocerca americana]|uniref:uncharacterized protein LOC124596079 n=1 Tax=Schistocerca americana TaxID=7009 RepID=UPI001F4FE9A4|nr:uncharacterized protein LOC124596079 [Schistocerca americana]